MHNYYQKTLPFWLLFFISLILSYFTVFYSNRLNGNYLAVFGIIIMSLPACYFFVFTKKYLFQVFSLTVLGLYALCFEYMAIHSGWPYGVFEYGVDIGGKIMNVVPWTVALAWLPILLGTYVIGQSFSKIKIMQIIYAALIMVAIDLVLDPGAVALGYWQWEIVDLMIYDVPLRNFFGWLISSLIGLCFLKLLQGDKKLNKNILYSSIIIVSFWMGINLWNELWLSVIVALLLLFLFYVILYRRSHSR